MFELSVLLELSRSLFNKLGIIILIAFLLSRSTIIKRYLLKSEMSVKDKITFSVVFGGLGIIGTYSGIHIYDAIANSRSIGVIVAGLFGGPLIGTTAGLIAGIHRILIPMGRFTALACGISTIIGGIIAGYAKKYIDNKPHKWIYGIGLTVIIEAIQMVIILLISKPFDQALLLVKIIFFPMAFINSFGTGVFLLLIQQIFEENERAAAVKAQLALNIATKTLPILRQGLNEQSAKDAAQIIYETTNFSAVSFSDTKIVLAFIGEGSDHHKAGNPINTEITRKVIKSNQYIIAQEKSEIECGEKSCVLKSAIIVPLNMNDQVAGTLKLYKTTENSITSSDIELTKGLGHLFSTQLELSKITYQEELLVKTELRMLQAQIQPHFLFNALNTIIGFCRTDALKARDLLLKLSHYLRTSFKTNESFIPLNQEFEHIESYLSIEEARFSERLKVIYHIDSNIQCMVPPMILQPIVENALKHGLMPANSEGVLTIEAKEGSKYVIIKISDNGLGMTNKQLNSLYDKDCKEHGIGINNVNDRLMSIYGTSLDIQSALGKGTSVTITIPKQED
ncbi:MAG: histidine kinase [Clostridia bacterium]|nr:histidine kinase [Clostridia bacterium]